MSEELNNLPAPGYLTAQDRIKSRPVYEAVFSDDTERFVDYYYQYKIRDNEILVIEEEGQIVSMLHLNPYTMIVNGYELNSNYIVAVATLEPYRHRGYMRALLEKALCDMASQEMPFTFLMPASESIYAPFDFVWICPHTELPPRVMQMDADGQNRYLASRYQMFCKRGERYMENLEAEKRAEEGEVFTGQIPPYMARITDVSQMLRLVNSEQERTLYLHIKDAIVEKNNGYFCWKVSKEYSRAEKMPHQPEHLDMEMSIGELTAAVFSGFRICLTEMV